MEEFLGKVVKLFDDLLGGLLKDGILEDYFFSITENKAFLRIKRLGKVETIIREGNPYETYKRIFIDFFSYAFNCGIDICPYINMVCNNSSLNLTEEYYYSTDRKLDALLYFWKRKIESELLNCQVIFLRQNSSRGFYLFSVHMYGGYFDLLEIPINDISLTRAGLAIHKDVYKKIEDLIVFNYSMLKEKIS